MIRAIRFSAVIILALSCLVSPRIFADKQNHDEGTTVTFRYKAPDGVSKVTVAGTFNQWNSAANPMGREADSGLWALEMKLPDGRHEYKFVCDGKTWHQDPDNPETTGDNHGGFNSVLFIGDTKASADSHGTPSISAEKWTGVHVISREEIAPWNIIPRDIYVWLPPSYESEPERRYPVLYMHDGQNIWDDPDCCFGHGGWYVNTLAARLIGEGKMKEVIIAGIPNSPARLAEYGVGADVPDDSGHAYSLFVTRVLKPHMDACYRTLTGPEDTALMGSSMGGVISFFMAHHHPDVFGNAACLSTAFGMDHDASGKTLSDLAALKGRLPVRFYLDSGTKGPAMDAAPLTKLMVEHLRQMGYRDGIDLLHFVDEGAEHNERFWRARLERPLLFLFGK